MPLCMRACVSNDCDVGKINTHKVRYGKSNEIAESF